MSDFNDRLSALGLPDVRGVPLVREVPIVRGVPFVRGVPLGHGVPQGRGVPQEQQRHGVPKVRGVPQVRGSGLNHLGSARFAARPAWVGPPYTQVTPPVISPFATYSLLKRNSQNIGKCILIEYVYD